MGTVHLLLIDDEVAFIEALARRLEHRGFEVDCAFSGKAALDRLEADQRIDVVVLDIQMPDQDGIETLHRIREKHPLVEIVMLTGHASVQTAVDAISHGAFDFLEKPCDLEALIDKAGRAAARKRERTARLLAARSMPYISERERQALISEIMRA